MIKSQANAHFYVGAHLSVSKGMVSMVQEALSLGADTIQFFSRNPRGAAAKALDQNDADQARDMMHQHRFGPLVAHAPYTLNPASPEPAVWELAVRMLGEDLERIRSLHVPYLVIHPGSRKTSPLEEGVSRIVAALNQALSRSSEGMILLETMSGMGSEIGGQFEDLAMILDGVHDHDRVGICLDTCHMFAAGYPVHTDPSGVLDALEQQVGRNKMKAVHLNDCKQPLGSHRDRHADLGQGEIGWNALESFLRDPRIQGLPVNLETPGGVDTYKREIEMIRQVFPRS